MATAVMINHLADSPFHQIPTRYTTSETYYDLYSGLCQSAYGVTESAATPVNPEVFTSALNVLDGEDNQVELEVKTYTELETPSVSGSGDSSAPAFLAESALSGGSDNMDLTMKTLRAAEMTSQIEMTSRVLCHTKKLFNRKASDSVDLSSWVRSHPHNWSSKEVLDWLYSIAKQSNIDIATFRADAFNSLTGGDLCRMDLAHFEQRDSLHGNMLYLAFKNLMRNSSSSDQSRIPITAQQFSDLHIEDDFPPFDNSPAEDNASESQMAVQEIDEAPARPSRYGRSVMRDPFMNGDCLSGSYTLNGINYDIDLEDTFQDLSDDGYSSGSSETSHTRDGSESSMDATGNDYHSMAMGSMSSSSDGLHGYARMPGVIQPTEKPAKRPPGRPRIHPPKDPNRPKGTRGRKPGQTTKGDHLWEFVRDLLRDHRSNPSVVKWLNEEEGIFCFVKSHVVADMWGQKKKNPKMTYEKLSRAMRFCRTCKYFDSPPKHDGYPKKLCFMFGPRAIGWK